MQARYLTAYSKSERSLVRQIKSYFGELGASYDDDFKINPANSQRVAQALLTQDYELTLTISWYHPVPSPALLIFDIDSPTDIYLPNLERLIASPAESYFGKLTLVYDSCGRSRNLGAFPLLVDLENVIRELIIATMLSAHGSDWWNTAGIDQKFVNDANAYRSNETSNLLHDYFEFHPIFYLDLKDLRKIIEDEDNKRTQLGRQANPSPFAAIFAHYDQVHIPDKIGEIRDLRNRVMHGKYLTEGNVQAIQVICSQFYRFLVRQGYVGDFRDRQLTQPMTGSR